MLDFKNSKLDTLPKNEHTPLKMVVSNKNLLFQGSIFTMGVYLFTPDFSLNMWVMSHDCIPRVSELENVKKTPSSAKRQIRENPKTQHNLNQFLNSLLYKSL